MQTEHGRYVGKSIRRVGDGRLVTGYGRFVDDIQPPGVLHATFVRSIHAHAIIRQIDVSEARAQAGVVAVLTGADLSALLQPQHAEELPPGKSITRYPLASERVRHVGDPVALIVGESRYAVKDAADLVTVDYEPLPALIDAEAALADGAPLIYPDWDDNLALDWRVEHGDVDRAFEEAAHQVSLRLVNQRIQAVFLEPRAILVEPQLASGELTAWATTQTPHRLRSGLSEALEIPEHRIRVVAPDVGGGFGAKGPVYPEYLAVAAAAWQLGRPVNWAETRSESFVGTNHARDQVQYVRAAVNADGTIRGLEVKIVAGCGAYGGATTAVRTGMMSAGPYRIENLRTIVTGALTNTTPTGAYRGAGRPEAAYLLERTMDAIARQLNLDPAEVRRRNVIPPDAFPYHAATGVTYDSGDYASTLDTALSQFGYEQARAKQEQARRDGRLAGIGMALYCEFAGPGWDSGEVRMDPSGTVTVTTGISPHGQGQETTFAQIVADVLCVPIEDVVLRASDTAITPQGVGTFGSRSLSIGGSAVLLAAREVREKMRTIAAHLLEAAPEDLDLRPGAFDVRGMPGKSVTIKEIARTAYQRMGLPRGLTPGLEATSYFQPDGRTFPFGLHIAQVEVEPDTGRITVQRYLAVDDCGPVINPQIVEGQVVGGLAQGLGQALQEAIIYDESGQLLSGSLMDYGAPKATQLPNFETSHTFTPSPVNPLGAKGVGEAGTTGGPPAVVNAVLDALAPLGITHLDMPLTSQRVWQAINTARARTNKTT